MLCVCGFLCFCLLLVLGESEGFFLVCLVLHNLGISSIPFDCVNSCFGGLFWAVNYSKFYVKVMSDFLTLFIALETYNFMGITLA